MGIVDTADPFKLCQYRSYQNAGRQRKPSRSVRQLMDDGANLLITHSSLVYHHGPSSVPSIVSVAAPSINPRGAMLFDHCNLSYTLRRL